MKKIIRRILREDVNNILYDKVVRMMRRPYIDFLRKNGLGLTEEEMGYVWKEYRNIINDKIENER